VLKTLLEMTIRVLSMYGGMIGGSLVTTDGAVNPMISIYGSGFSFQYGELPQGDYMLTGFFSDGTPIDAAISNHSGSMMLFCLPLGSDPASTPTLAADQDNYCEDWAGVMQPGDDLSRAGLELVDLSLGDLSLALLVDADLTDADLSGTDLTGADLTGAILVGSQYDEFTIFPSGDTYDLPPWGLPNDAAPWNAGMEPAPEPSFGLMVVFGAMGLAGLARLRGGMGWKRRGDQ
jgi:hypothetical protein